MSKNKTPHVCILLTSYIKDNSDMLAEISSRIPGARISIIADSDLLADIRAAGHVPSHVVKRMSLMAMSAEAMGADIIYNTCSSVGEVADIYRNLVSIPVVKIDDAMSDLVGQQGGKIALVATVESTLPPSARLIKRKAAENGKECSVDEILVKGAYEALRSGDREKHNSMVLETIKSCYDKYDAVVMAQVSMRVLLPELENSPIPVYCSFHTGAERLAKVYNDTYNR